MTHARWTPEQAWQWYKRQPWLAGFNYVPSSAANTTEWWQDSAVVSDALVDRELGWAAELGFNSVRIFLQYLVWNHDPQAFLARLDGFLGLAARHGLSVMPTLFDDCTFGEPMQRDPFLGKQREPIPGMILPSWTPSPGHAAVVDRDRFPLLREYVVSVIRRFRDDPRIVLWDLYNEPGNGFHGCLMNGASLPLLRASFTWAREAEPQQPLSAGLWNYAAPELQDLHSTMTDESDVITFHCYADRAGLLMRIKALESLARPLICTEWMSRVCGSRFDTDLPVFQERRMGCYMWGFVNGRTQAHYSWENRPGGDVNPVHGWFHDILYADGKPYRPEELKAIRSVLQGNP